MKKIPFIIISVVVLLIIVAGALYMQYAPTSNADEETDLDIIDYGIIPMNGTLHNELLAEYEKNLTFLKQYTNTKEETWKMATVVNTSEEAQKFAYNHPDDDLSDAPVLDFYLKDYETLAFKQNGSAFTLTCVDTDIEAETVDLFISISNVPATGGSYRSAIICANQYVIFDYGPGPTHYGPFTLEQ